MWGVRSVCCQDDYARGGGLLCCHGARVTGEPPTVFLWVNRASHTMRAQTFRFTIGGSVPFGETSWLCRQHGTVRHCLRPGTPSLE